MMLSDPTDGLETDCKELEFKGVVYSVSSSCSSETAFEATFRLGDDCAGFKVHDVDGDFADQCRPSLELSYSYSYGFDEYSYGDLDHWTKRACPTLDPVDWLEIKAADRRGGRGVAATPRRGLHSSPRRRELGSRRRRGRRG